MARTVHRLRLGLADLLQTPYPTIPFDLPPGAESVEVRLAYDTDAAVIDLGCEGPAGWRGWSGGARDRLVIGPTAATPGYLPGELETGQWSVQLGLYRLPADPIEVTVTVISPAQSRVEPEPAPLPPREAAPRGSTRRLPAEPGLTWYAGDLHAHSTHSDGEQSLAELAALAVTAGLDFLAVTDHNTVSHHGLLPAVGGALGITLLPGQEVTTARGHANVFGDVGWIDFRRPAADWIADAQDRGGLVSINHPLEGEWAWQHRLAALPQALELWHITWFRDLRSTEPWGLWPQWRPDAVLLGGSDYHNPDHGYLPGTPTTWVAAESPDPAAIMAAIAAGRTAISHPGPDSAVLLRVGDELVALGAEGAVLTDVDGRAQLVTSPRARIPLDRAGRPPYRLTDPERRLLALSP
ncbi:CehA/McbA family metallohydrolase [Ruania halotolerans]|uniref:CehA/McbA family metallohydrolase n=1 Tax=Ruania halotolerans TaxID=2897773 RepID=UPI001E64EF6B|nr:CehA/McbA family metallohydrolase [Ruania halotolerans]UFU06692.1 CehA/McbA family metallohydrolase [Ruania halotolerans]